MKLLLKTRWIVSLIALPLFIFSGCEKFLDEKSDKKLAVPTTLRDLQALLDNYQYTNYAGPFESEASTDDYYLTGNDYDNLYYESDKNIYVWDPEIPFSDKGQSGWGLAYSSVYYSNTILEKIKNIDKDELNGMEWNSIKGQALYIRANALLDMVLIWAVPYDERTADTDLGLPLRMDTDFNVLSKRSTLKETYEQIIKDLKAARDLLPLKAISKWRVSKPAAYGLLARTFLSMRDYDNTLIYADSCLQAYNVLVDYNTLDNDSRTPFIENTFDEVIFYRIPEVMEPTKVSKAKIVEKLYDSYQEDDLRKSTFFRSNTDGSMRFKGSYSGNTSPFSGISTNEVLLMRAECLARKGDITNAINDLNTLLVNRWVKDKFIPLTASSNEKVLALVLEERRKELIMRGLRWMDIRRLNKEGYNISLTRSLNGQIISLPANDPKFTLPIPDDIISITKMQQNER